MIDLTITPADCVGALSSIPIHIVQIMLLRQKEQTGEACLAAFQMKGVAIGANQGGFNWDQTPEGSAFWHEVLTHHEYDLFYQKYPLSLFTSIQKKPYTKTKYIYKEKDNCIIFQINNEK